MKTKNNNARSAFQLKLIRETVSLSPKIYSVPTIIVVIKCSTFNQIGNDLVCLGNLCSSNLTELLVINKKIFRK